MRFYQSVHREKKYKGTELERELSMHCANQSNVENSGTVANSTILFSKVVLRELLHLTSETKNFKPPKFHVPTHQQAAEWHSENVT